MFHISIIGPGRESNEECSIDHATLIKGKIYYEITIPTLQKNPVLQFTKKP